ncbi:hypothetical protein [Actinomadura rupiterrae]|uniref:hypothetical protein n=1 Tax=Actinomadura rupiterrae TaxID=559627 RepID=UPI0020A25DF0|nr:hypothetical protein [Actinomadura rupiterrae]MCP2341988.1 uncharacterized protein YukE [Actinomadura rupiterrae]
MGKKQATYALKAGHPTGNPAGYDAATIKNLLQATDPGAVNAAGDAYVSASSAFQGLLAAADHAVRLLDGGWGGEPAESAKAALRRLSTTANALTSCTQQAGTALRQYGAVLPQFKYMKWPEGQITPQNQPMADAAARIVMSTVNTHVVQAYSTMPGHLNKDLPTVDDDRFVPPSDSSPSPFGGPGDGAGRLPGSHPPGGHGYSPASGDAPRAPHGGGHPQVPGSGHHPAPGAGTPPGSEWNPPDWSPRRHTDLSGMTPSTGVGGPNLPNGGWGGPGVDGSGLIGGPPGGFGGTGNPFGFTPTLAPGSSPGGLGQPFGTPGSGTAGNGGLGSGSTAQRSGTGVPVPSDAKKEEEERLERERESWLAEDADIWRGAQDVAPPIIGEMPARAGRVAYPDAHEQEGPLAVEELEALLERAVGHEAAEAGGHTNEQPDEQKPSEGPDVAVVEELLASDHHLDEVTSTPEVVEAEVGDPDADLDDLLDDLLDLDGPGECDSEVQG